MMLFGLGLLFCLSSAKRYRKAAQTRCVDWRFERETSLAFSVSLASFQYLLGEELTRAHES